MVELQQVVGVVVRALLLVVLVEVGGLVLVVPRCRPSSRGSSSSLVLLVVLGLLVRVVLQLCLVVEVVQDLVVELQGVVEVVVRLFLQVVPVVESCVPLLLFGLRWWSSSGLPPLGHSPRGTLHPPRTACSIDTGLGELRRLNSACPPSRKA